MLDEFLKDVKEIYSNIKNNITDINSFKLKWKIEKSIGERYQELCEREYKKKRGSFYTPLEVVNFMVEEITDEIDFKANPFVKIIDPSCGGGYFLKEVYYKLVKMARKCGIAEAEKHVVENNLYGFDLDINAVMITTIELYEISGFMPKNIDTGDFLFDAKGEYDFIIGNPPYMGHKVLTGDYRKSLYEKFNEVFKDKGDMSYCFIKKSIDALKPSGRLCFFTSRYILEALNGEGVRGYIKKSGSIKRIIDFYGIRLVKGAGIDNIILDFEKSKGQDRFEFFRFKEEAKDSGKRVFDDIRNKREVYTRRIDIEVKELKDEGWSFLSDIEAGIINKINGVELLILCEGYQGIISGCDAAFVLKKDEAKRLKIEEGLLKPWIKNKNVNAFNVTYSDEFIIYSDVIDDEEKYKSAISYIGKYRERLERRRECLTGSRSWFQLQWGRKMELFEGEKIIYPFKAAKNRFALDKGNYFSADVYALKVRPLFENRVSLQYIAGILNSSVYEFYIKSMAKKLGDNIYEYYPNKIMKVRIPEYIKDVEVEVVKGGQDLISRIDSILIKHFGITEDEYEVIRRWCR